MEDYLIKNRKFVDDVLDHLKVSYFDGLVLDILAFASDSGCYVVITCNRVDPLGIIDLYKVIHSDFIISEQCGKVRIEIYNPNYLYF